MGPSGSRTRTAIASKCACHTRASPDWQTPLPIPWITLKVPALQILVRTGSAISVAEQGSSVWKRIADGLADWSVPRQLQGQNSSSTAAESASSREVRPRLEQADRVGTSICPYCAVGCAQLVYARGNDIIHIEGDPRSPINQGTLCPKGAATLGWLQNSQRLTTMKYRAPYSDHWEERPLDWAMERIANLVKQTRDDTFVQALPDGTVVNHTLGLAELGGATLDNEE